MQHGVWFDAKELALVLERVGNAYAIREAGDTDDAPGWAPKRPADL